MSRPPGFPWLQAHDQRYLLFGSFIAENHPGPIQEAGINTSLKLGLRNLFVFVWASFLLVTSLYCLLAFLPYTFYALIKAPAYDWMPWLVRNYAYLYWITLAGLTWACWPERKGRGFTLLFSVLLLLGVFVTVHPVLASVQSNVAAYAWAAGSLLPIIAFAVLHAVSHWPQAQDAAAPSWSYAVATWLAITLATMSAVGTGIRGYLETHSAALHRAVLPAGGGMR